MDDQAAQIGYTRYDRWVQTANYQPLHRLSLTAEDDD